MALAVVVLAGVTQVHRIARVAHADSATPRVYLDRGRPLVTSYGASSMAARALSSRQATAVSLAAEDLDVDGINELAIGFKGVGGGFVAIHRGNLDAFAPQSQASFDAIARSEFVTPFLPDAQVINLPESPDLLAGGDFIGHDANAMVAAARGGRTLYVLSKGASGQIEIRQKLELSGGVVNLASHRTGDGKYAELMVGTHDARGARLLTLVGSEDGLAPVSDIGLDGDAASFAFGNLDGDGVEDTVLVAGGKVLLRHADTGLMETVETGFPASRVATGRFIFDRSPLSQISVLDTQGAVHLFARSNMDTRPITSEEVAARLRTHRRGEADSSNPVGGRTQVDWKEADSYAKVGIADGSGNAPLMFRTRLANNGADDVVLLSSARMSVLAHPDVNPTSGVVIERRDLGADALAAVTTRVNVDGRPGVVYLMRGQSAPYVMMPLPDPVFYVNRTDDPAPGTAASNCLNTGFADVSSSCSLRQAILKSNGDTIMLEAKTYTLSRAKVAGDFTGQNGALYVNTNTTIVGFSQAGTIIQAGGSAGNGVDMVMAVNEDINPITNASASISNLTMRYGTNRGSLTYQDNDGGCMEFDTGSSGNANLTLTNVTLTDCRTTAGSGGGLVVFNYTSPGSGLATLSNVTIANSSVAWSGLGVVGGGMWVTNKARVAVTNSTFSNDQATQVVASSPSNIVSTGGGVYITFSDPPPSPQSLFHGTTFTGNAASGNGGGLYTSARTVVDQGSSFINNTAGSGNVTNATDGGGLYISTFTVDSVQVSNTTFTGNSVPGRGGAILTGNTSGSGALTLSYSRLAGNSAGISGSNLENIATTVTATNNWWGTNSPASTIHSANGSVSATTTFDPYLVLTVTPATNKVRINQSTTVAADIQHNNSGNPVTASNLTVLPGVASSWVSANLGSYSNGLTSLQTGGTFNISGASESGNTATITTSTNHNFVTNGAVTISGVGVAGYNGTFIITGTTANTFTYTNPSSGLGSSSGGTASYPLIGNTVKFTAGGTPGTGSASNQVDAATVQTTIYVLAPPTMTKAFSPTTVTPGTSSTLTFSVSNPNSIAINASFTDSLPSGLVVAATPGVTNTCGGTVTANAAATSIGYSNAGLAVGNCSISVKVSSATDNVYNNSVNLLSSDAGDAVAASTASLTVIRPPTISKVFGASAIGINGTTSLTFTLSSTNTNLTLTGVSFTDSLPSGLVVATPGNLTNNCGGTATGADGATAVGVSGVSLAAGASCTISVNVQGTSGGIKNNSVSVSSTNGGSGNTSNASLTVVAAPTLSKTFGAVTVPLNSTTSLSFTVTNPNSFASLTGIAFSDTLPAGLVIDTPNGLSGSCGGGTITATAGTSVVSLSGASLGTSGTCTFSVTVKGTTAGDQVNTTGTITSNESGAGSTATATLKVLAPPTISKAFSPTSIAVGATTSLTFTLTNPSSNTVALTGVNFTDTLPTGLTVANATATVCSGTVTDTAPTSISLSGASIAPNGQCQFSVTVTGATAGQYTNTTGNVGSTNGGTGTTATANLTVLSAPSIAEVFGASTVPVNGSTTLTFTITNGNAGSSLSGLAFTDNLPSGLTVSATPNVVGACGGTVTAAGNATSISLSGGTLAANTNCTISVSVTGTTAGVKNNSVSVSSTEVASGNTANASLTVVGAPTFSKSFGAVSVPVNGTTSLTFQIQNTSTAALHAVQFTDSLPSGLLVASTPNIVGSCGGGTISATGGGNSISLSGATLNASSSCSFSVDVQGTSAGDKVNTTGQISSTESGTGGTATATLKVLAAPQLVASFSPSPIATGGVTSLSFTITNPAANTLALTGVGLTDNLPSGLSVANSSASVCGGTVTLTNPTSIVLSGASIGVGGQCQFSVTVTGVNSGNYTNTTGNVTSTNGGTGNSASPTLTVGSALVPDLTLGMVHAGNFAQGQTGDTFTLTVTNAGTGSTDGSTVTVTDTMPAGFTVTGISGSGWTCTTVPLSCTRTDVLAAGASYPAITIVVNVDSNAGASLTNTASVTGGGDASPGNNGASNTIAVGQTAQATLSGVIASKLGTQNARNWTYTITNNGATTANNTQITGFTLTQTFGAACTPVITSPLPISGAGNIAPGGSGSVAVVIDFTGCASTARFRASATFGANAGANGGTSILNNQLQ